MIGFLTRQSSASQKCSAKPNQVKLGGVQLEFALHYGELCRESFRFPLPHFPRRYEVFNVPEVTRDPIGPWRASREACGGC